MRLLKKIFFWQRDRMYENAIDHYNNGLYAQAIGKFQQILSDRRRLKSLDDTLARFYCGQAHRRLGEVLFAMGECQKALEHFEEALALDPDKIEIYHYLGTCYSHLGQTARAQDAFYRILQKDPTLLNPKARLEIIFHNLGVWDTAVTYFRNVLDDHPRYADIHYYLGLTLLGKGNINQAAAEFEAAVEINPGFTPARIKAGLAQASLGRYQEAADHLNTVLADYPHYADVHCALGMVYFHQSALNAAVDSLGQALKINPSYASAQIHLGLTLCRLNRFTEGLKTLNEAASNNSDDKTLQTVLGTMRKLSLDRRAAPVAISKFLSWYESQTGLPYGSRSHAHPLVLGPSFANLLSILKALPEDNPPLVSQLLSLLEEAIELYPAYSDIHNSLGTFYLKAKKYDLAVKAFQKAKQLNPNYMIARINLFHALKDRGDLSAALKEGRELFRMELSYPDFYCAVAEVHLAMGDVESAAQAVCKVLAQRPTFAPAHFLLAQIYLKGGEMANVAKSLRLCLESKLPRREFERAKALYEQLSLAPATPSRDSTD